MLGRLELGRVFLGGVAQILDVLVAEERVVVEIDLGVERDHVARAGHDERIDLDDRGVQCGEGLVHGEQELGRALDLLAFEAEREGEAAGVEPLHAARRVDREAHDLLRVLRRHFLDVHAALGRRHRRDAAALPVDQHAGIELALDVAAVLDIDALHLAALGAGLLGDEHAAEHLGGFGGRFRRRLHEPHAALAAGIVLEAAGAAPAGVDLRLHHIDRAGERGGDLLGLLRRVGDAALRHRDAEFLKERLRLVLVNIHGGAVYLIRPAPRAQRYFAASTATGVSVV